MHLVQVRWQREIEADGNQDFCKNECKKRPADQQHNTVECVILAGAHRVMINVDSIPEVLVTHTGCNFVRLCTGEKMIEREQRKLA